MARDGEIPAICEARKAGDPTICEKVNFREIINSLQVEQTLTPEAMARQIEAVSARIASIAERMAKVYPSPAALRASIDERHLQGPAYDLIRKMYSA